MDNTTDEKQKAGANQSLQQVVQQPVPVEAQAEEQKAKTYYRALVYPETRARWRAKKYTSSHSHAPDEWRDLWKNSEGNAPEEAYPLALSSLRSPRVLGRSSSNWPAR